MRKEEERVVDGRKKEKRHAEERKWRKGKSGREKNGEKEKVVNIGIIFK